MSPMVLALVPATSSPFLKTTVWVARMPNQVIELLSLHFQ